jgi:CHASE1-domain containing sensor protein
MKEPTFKKDLFTALIFLVILLSFNFFLRQITKTRLLDHSQESFKEASIDIHHAMEDRISSYATLLFYGRKLFEVNGAVTRSGFDVFFSSSLNKQKDSLMAIDAIAYIEKVKDKSAYVSRIRAEKTNTPFEFLYFNLNNATDKKEGYIFNYLTPHIGTSRYFGYDAVESEELLKSLKTSGEEDKLVLTYPISLFGKEQVFLILPIYKNKNTTLASRLESLEGYIVLALSPDKLFDTVFSYQEISKSINIKVYYTNDRTREPFYLESNNDEITRLKDEEKLIATKELIFADKKMYISTEASPKVELSLFEQVFPDIIFIGGSVLVISFFFFMISFRMSCDEKEKE